MLGHPIPSCARCGRRGGFTLIELLVIIAILAVLIALTAGATIRMISVQQQTNTQQAVDKIQSIMDVAIKTNVDKWKTETIDGTLQEWILTNLTGNDANCVERSRVIYVKLKLRQYYPQTFAEATNPAPLPPLQSYVNYLSPYGITSATTTPYQYQSGACITMALQVGASGFNIDDLGRGGSMATIPVDPAGGPSLPMLIDAWGTPICFSRFPTGCRAVNPQGAKTANQDPLDPKGTLMNGSWPATNRTAYSTLVLQDLAPANQSYYLWPVLGSAGRDRQFGINASTMYNFSPSNAGQESDNIYSKPAGAGQAGAGQ
jgi:prepilin-type N-terminal cleavage/methylation domain-containing protein